MKLKTFLIINLLITSVTGFSATGKDNLDSLIKKGNQKLIAKYFSDKFASTVHLILLDKDGQYNEQEAAIVLEDFFYSHYVLSCTIHPNGGSNNGTQFFKGTLETSDEKFVISYTHRSIGNQLGITGFKIELKT
jgi:hypothetical protein